MNSGKTLSVAVSALTGAAYAVLTMVLAPISYGPVQLRMAEVLCILPFFLPCTSWGLFLGCMIANVLTGNIFDVVFGALATLAAALASARIGRGGDNRARRILSCLMPVAFNAVIIGAVICRAYNGMSILRHPGVFALNALQIALGEAAVMLVGGLPLMRLLPTLKAFRELKEKIDRG